MGKWFISLVGILWIIVGIFGLIATKRMILVLSNWIKSTSRQSLGLLGLVFGVLLLIAAPSVRESWFILALGIISCLKGTMVVLMSEKSLQAIIDWWLQAPEGIYKGWAILVLTLGVVMFYII